MARSSRKTAPCASCGESRTVHGRGMCSRCYQRVLREERIEEEALSENMERDEAYVSIEMPVVVGRKMIPQSVNVRLSKRQGQALAALKVGGEISGLTYRAHKGRLRPIRNDGDVVKVLLDLVATGLSL